MILKLENKKRNFSTKAKICSNIFTQTKGLMFSSKLKDNNSILIKFNMERLAPIHMFFVFFPIDAIWINSSNEIVYIKRNIKPFTPFIGPKKPAIAILETPKNYSKNLVVGDKLSIK